MASLPNLTVEQVRQRASAQSFERGEDYYDSGAIFETVRRGNALEGYCEGSSPSPYHVQATLDENGVAFASCTCPYDWGGDCKHIVALLLTYVYEPEAFEARQPVEEVLAQRSQDELIALVRQMVARHPDLASLIDHPLPTGHSRAAPVNTDSFRRELRYAMRGYDGWGDYDPHGTVRSIANTARQFAAQGDWFSARAIYSTILDECLEDAGMFDDEGDFIGALCDVVDGLTDCLKRPEILDDDAQRQATLDSLLAAYIWDIDFGGVDLSGDAPEAILIHARPADLPRIREQVQAALKGKQGSPYGQWGVEAYTRFLIELDALEGADPETVLGRLHEEGLYEVEFEKLLQMDRLEEAIALVQEYLTAPYERLQAVEALAEVGQGDVAVRLAEEVAEDGYNHHLGQWLLGQYKARGDREAYLKMQRARMLDYPTEQYYAELKEAAEALGRWDEIRPEIIAGLKERDDHGMLARVYLHDQEWDAAWEVVAQMPRQSRYGWADWDTFHLEIEVAERSRHARPRRAVAVYVEHARHEIGRRSRDHYRVAAEYLAVARDLYRQLGEESAWQALIATLREEFRKLPALQDELNKAGL